MKNQKPSKHIQWNNRDDFEGVKAYYYCLTPNVRFVVAMIVENQEQHPAIVCPEQELVSFQV